MQNGKVWLTPLGGVGGVGNACFLVEYNGISVAMDCGLDPQAFHESTKRDPNSPLVVPPSRMNILDESIAAGNDVYGLITHGHLDHVGAVAELVKRGIEDDHLLMSSWTAKILRRHADNLSLRIDDRRTPPWKIVRERDRSATNKLVVDSDGLKCYIFPLNHSVHGTFGVSARAGGKKVVYLSDFKFYGFARNIPDNSNSGSMCDAKNWFDGVLREIRGQTGVDCLLLDVMNSDLEGFTPPEEEVLANLEQIVEEAPGRVFVSVISSNFQRISEIIKMCRRKNKKIGFIGSSMRATYDMLQDSLLLFALTIEGRKEEYSPSIIYRDRELQQGLKDFLGVVDNSDEADVILISGTQGEENSATSRLASDGVLRDKNDKVIAVLKENDWFTFSGRVIPGNEPYLRPTVMQLARRCAKVILHMGEMVKLGIRVSNVIERFVHVSGHGQLGDMERVLERLSPIGAVVPIHAPRDRVELFEKRFGDRYNIQRLDVGETLEI